MHKYYTGVSRMHAWQVSKPLASYRVFHRKLCALFPRKLRIAETKNCSRNIHSQWVYLMKLIVRFISRANNKTRIIIFLTSGNRRIVSIRILPSIVENYQINSIYRGVWCLLYFSVSRTKKNHWIWAPSWGFLSLSARFLRQHISVNRWASSGRNCKRAAAASPTSKEAASFEWRIGLVVVSASQRRSVDEYTAR